MNNVEIAHRHGRRPGFAVACCLAILLFVPLSSWANVWQDSFGQRWFYEVRSTAGETMAGTWWESSLEPGSTYTISFDVKKLQGEMNLRVGGAPAIAITNEGRKSFDFAVTEGGKRHLIFLSATSDVAASVGEISVTRQGGEKSVSGGDSGGSAPANTVGSDAGKGHYLSFSRERNLKTEMMDVLAGPRGASSNFQWRVANDLDEALNTAGVKGFQVTIDWGTVEKWDGGFDWQLLDDNMKVAKAYGLKFVVKVLDRSFDGSNPMPAYFPSNAVLWSTGSGGSKGFVSKRWDPYVYTRMIRLYKAIAHRYDSDVAFGGIASTESAPGNFTDPSYSVAKYETAMTQIVTQTQGALKNGQLFWYLNFIRGNNTINLNHDSRVRMLGQVPHDSLVLGGPDITPDVKGMPGSVNNYRVHARKTMPSLPQFCHLQHVDLGLGGRNVKDNTHRIDYLEKTAAVRERESQSWFTGTPATFEFDTLDPTGKSLVTLHPTWQLGQLWQPRELFDFGQANFGCEYVFWNYRESWGNWSNQFTWPDIEPIIIDTQYFAK